MELTTLLSLDAEKSLARLALKGALNTDMAVFTDDDEMDDYLTSIQKQVKGED